MELIHLSEVGGDICCYRRGSCGVIVPCTARVREKMCVSGKKGVIAFRCQRNTPLRMWQNSLICPTVQWNVCLGNGNKRCQHHTSVTAVVKKKVVTEVATNRLATMQQLLQTINAGPHASTSECSLRRELHDMNISSWVTPEKGQC